MTEENIVIEETDKSYLAGLFDGEGCVSIHKSGNLVVVIGNTNETVLNYVHSLYKGSVQKTKKKDNRKQFYIWQSSGTYANIFLKDIHSYLVIKQLQVAVALEYYKGRQKLDPNIRYKGRKDKEKLRIKTFKEYLEKIR